jgi:ATP-binding cassette, subfamily A (ABC1), member 3
MNNSQFNNIDDINNLGFKLAFNTAFGMALTTAMFSIFYLKERVSRAKLLQFLSGVNKFVFWLTSFAIDYLQFLLITLVYLAVLGAYDTESYNTSKELSRNFYLLATFGFAVLPYTYLLSFLFDAPTTGFVKLALIFIVTGDFSYFAFSVFNIPFLYLSHIAKPFGKFSNFFPHYSLARGMSNLFNKHSKINECKETCKQLEICKPYGVNAFCDTPQAQWKIDSYPKFNETCCKNSNFYSFDEDGLGLCLISLFFVGIASFTLLFLIDYEILKKIFGYVQKDR